MADGTMRSSLERVVIVSDDSVASGGAATVALASIRLLRRRGVPVTLLTGDAGVNPELDALGVDVTALGGTGITGESGSSEALKALYNGPARRLVAGWIERHDTPGTVYHLHNWHKFLSPSIFAPLRRVEDRLFMTAHDYFLVCPNGGYFLYPQQQACHLVPMSLACMRNACDRRSYKHKLFRVARQQVRQGLFALGRTRATVIAVHDGMVPLLTRGGFAPASIQILRNPVVPWRRERVAAEGNRGVFFVGRIEPDKGVDLLAEAARRAGVPLTVIGDGPLRADLTQRFPEATFLGRRSPAEVAGLVASARMVAVPTRWRETYGLVAFEALMSGIPVIASTFALVADEIVGRGLGLACDPHDMEALTGCIRTLAGDDGAVGAMSRKAFATGHELAPTPEAWCDDLLRLYDDKLRGALRPVQAASAATGQEAALPARP